MKARHVLPDRSTPPVTDDDRRDLARLAEQERDFQESLKVEAADRDEFEPDELP
jgi:hypothetical protein